MNLEQTPNIFGQHGPRCPVCSGLGQVLRPSGEGRITRSTTRCECHGTGIDQELLRATEMSTLLNRVDTLERLWQQKLRMESQTKHGGKMSRQYWSEMIAWTTADGTAVANSTTEAILFPNVVVPGNYMADGRALRLTLYGRWSNVVTAVPTMTFRVRWGGVAGTVLAASSAIVTPAAATTAAMWCIEIDLQTRLNGATGTIFAVGKVTVGEDAAPTFGTVTNYGVVSFMGSAGLATPAAVVADLTPDTALSVTLTWSAANASNTATGHTYTTESLN